MRNAKHAIILKRDKPNSLIPKYGKYSKEAQLINGIQNISPYLGKRITEKDIKSIKYWQESNIATHRNENDKSRVDHSQAHSVSSKIPNVKLVKKYVNKNIFTDRNNSTTTNLPPIIIDADNIKGFTTDKGHGSQSVMPEFKSPHIDSKQLQSFNSFSKSRKLKPLMSQSPSFDNGHQRSFLQVNNSKMANQNKIQRNDGLKLNPNLSISA